MKQDPKPLRGVPALTWRALIVAACGSLLISISSVYVALRLSALPWPTIFVVVVSMAVLRLLGRTSINEINVANTGMSAGAMVGGALAFTVPGLFIAGVYAPFDRLHESLSSWLWPKALWILGVSILGVVVGAFLCYRNRARLIARPDLPYPIGQAAAETLEAGDQGGAKARVLLVTLVLSAVFTTLRDRLKIIPDAPHGQIGPLPIALNLSPMAIAIGYIIGLGPAAYWLAGNVLSRVVFDVWGVASGTFASPAAAHSFTLTSAIGLMVGSGVAIVIGVIRDRLTAKSKATSRATSPTRGWRSASAVAAFAFLLAWALGLSPLVSALFIVGAAFVAAMSAVVTGQTGINPMEIFGIIVLLAVRLITPLSHEHAFWLAAAIAVVAGYTGDMMNDFQAGHIVKTDPKAQLVAEVVGGLVGAVAASFALLFIIATFGGVGGTTGLTAAQAHSVAALVSGLGDPVVFVSALLLGTLLYMKGVPAMIIGIGMLLSQGMSIAIAIGGLLSWLVKRLAGASHERLTATAHVVAAGLLGGEALMGTIFAFVAMAGH